MNEILVTQEADNQLIVEEQPAENVVITETDDSTNTVTVTSEPDSVVVTTHTAPEQLIVTHGGSVYRNAVEGGYAGTETEWISEIFDSKASITYVTGVFTSAQEAWAQDITSMYAQVGDNFASLVQLSEVVTTQDQARATLRNDLRTEFQEDITAVNTSLSEAISNETLARSTEMNQLETDFAGNYASNLDLQQAISTATSAMAQDFSQLEASIDGTYATQVQLNESIATESSARNTQINNMIATVESGFQAEYDSFILTLANETSARTQMGQQLTADLNNGISSTIERIDTVEVDANSALATARTALEAEIEDQGIAINSRIDQVVIDSNQALASSESTLRTEFDNKLGDETTALNLRIDTAESNASSALATAEQTLQADYDAKIGDVNTALNTRIDTAESNADSAVATAKQELEATINGVDTAVNNRIDTVAADTDGNAQSISSIEGQINSPTTGLSAAYSLAQEAKSTADGAVTTTTNISNRIDGVEDSFSDSFIDLETTLNTKTGELESRAALGVNSNGEVTGLEATAGSAISKLKLRGDVIEVLPTTGTTPLLSVNTTTNLLDVRGRLILGDGHTVASLDDIRAEDGQDGSPGQDGQDGTNGTDGNDGATGAGFYGGTFDDINWSAGRNRFLQVVGRYPVPGDIFTQTRTDGTDTQTLMRNDADNSWKSVALQVNGSIVARDTLAGDTLIAGTRINAPKIFGGEFVVAASGADYFEITRSTPFGMNNDLTFWYGQRTSDTWNYSTNEPKYSGMTRLNAREYRATDGSRYFGGSFSAGTISNSLQTTTHSTNPIIETGLFGSNGGQILVTASFSFSTSSGLESGSCPSGSNPGGTLYIEREEGGSWTTVAQLTMTGTYTCNDEGPEYIAEATMGDSVNFTDNDNSTSSRNYRARADVFNTGSLGGTKAQSLSIVTTEA